MCTSHTPKVEQPTQKDPVYMSNPYLDGLGIGAESSGRNSLRIDMGSPVSTAINRPLFPPPGGGGYGGGSGGFLGIPTGGGLGIGRTRTVTR